MADKLLQILQQIADGDGDTEMLAMRGIACVEADRKMRQPEADPYFLGDVARRAWLDHGSNSWVIVGRAIVEAITQSQGEG